MDEIWDICDHFDLLLPTKGYGTKHFIKNAKIARVAAPLNGLKLYNGMYLCGMTRIHSIICSYHVIGTASVHGGVYVISVT